MAGEKKKTIRFDTVSTPPLFSNKVTARQFQMYVSRLGVKK
jgi:hypothetical protein